MNPYIRRVSLFLFGSGFCALVYQVAWLRLLRLIFGSSTSASAAVLAVFMGGLGLGSWFLGRRGDRTSNPLGLYGNLELGIALAAAASPLLVGLARAGYVGLGGTEALGATGGLLVRMALASLVLAVPTFLMGGTLPAAVRSVTRSSDSGRHTVGLIYAVNTLGAVAGAMVTTFVLIELLGIERTIWLAALLNLLVALAARSAAREQGSLEPAGEAPAAAPATPAGDKAASGAPFRLVLVAAAVVGFVFFLMELVWYRMLSPILGGSTYTFGVILAVALLGIGVGGLIYGLTAANRRPTGLHFAATCVLEALAIAIPFALGDWIALAALELRGVQVAGFGSMVASWTAVAAVVVLPASLIAGYQFPVLVALLGRGSQRVAREVGLAYAWNTGGAILGSIAGGFGLIPLLSAPGAWRLSVWLLLALTALFLGHSLRHRVALRAVTVTATLALAALLASFADGPSPFWRHSGIGAGRLKMPANDPNGVRDFLNYNQRNIAWEEDGRESSVALVQGQGYAFYVNGKSDGSARGDAGTQVMGGLVGTMLHPDPRTGLVVGLGTGSTAGWMADVETMERVDVVELEPVIRRVAEDCAPVNRDVLDKSNVRFIYADAREFLLATDESYDVIFSEPSNPYRAGVASLFTREFYEAARSGLTESGIFIQWLQAYEVNSEVVRTAYTTLGSVFPHVETWQVHRSDLLLVASPRAIDHDVARTARRTASEPYASALASVWGLSGVEGFYTGFVAAAPLARAILEFGADPVNTDDRPVIEYGFARHVGRRGGVSVEELRDLAARRGEDRPPVTSGEIDWPRVVELREARGIMFGARPPAIDDVDAARRRRHDARVAWNKRDLAATHAAWWPQESEPVVRADLAMLAEAAAEAGDDRTPELAARLVPLQPIEAQVAMARWHLRSGRPDEAGFQLAAALTAYRDDPWPHTVIMSRALELASETARASAAAAPALLEALAEPFSLQLFRERRLLTRVDLARHIDFERLCAETFEAYEPWVIWRPDFLRLRRDCYESSGHPLAARAARQLRAFHAGGELPLWWGLLPEDAVEVDQLDVPDELPESRSEG